MSSSDIAVSVRGLSKSYTIAHQAEKHVTLAETALSHLRHPFARAKTETFHALKDVSFDIQKGDVVGIIGRNGAGKSTLLKILSRITEPTTGQIDLYGRVGSLLEVGTGFHPELTGRENIFLNGAILGMNKAEIKKQFDAIVDFAGVEKFLDTPVKRYSSGMYVRLAFAVAAHLKSEILVVDEVLAVGDAEFQKKCLGKMSDLADGGRTVFFVSHHMQSVQALCSRAMYLENGTCKYLGEVGTATKYYVKSFELSTIASVSSERRPGTGEFRFASIKPKKETFECGESKTIELQVRRCAGLAGRFFISCHVFDDNGFMILQCDSGMVGPAFDVKDSITIDFSVRTPWLKAGVYRLDFFIHNAGIIDCFEHACDLRVMPLLPYPIAGSDSGAARGVVFADYTYSYSNGSLGPLVSA